MRKFVNVLVVLVILLSVFVPSVVAEQDMTGMIVILHSNDVHGAIDGYAKIAALRDEYVSRGAEVILADAGDYSQGTVAVSSNKGLNAVKMMNAVGYDVATIGNHEFDFGYQQLADNMLQAEFKVLCANVFDAQDKTIFDASVIIQKDDVKIGFFGLETPEAQTKANPALIKGLTFLGDNKMYECAQKQIDNLRADGADVIIGLVHLGVDQESEPNTSYDLYANITGVDLLIDAHSHTVMTSGANGEPIQSTGTAFANIGVVVIDKQTKKIIENKNVSTADIEDDPTVTAVANEINSAVEAEYGQVFAESLVDLNGQKAPGNRTEETNLGDLITEAMMWAINKDQGSVSVDADHVVAITNGGGIRASISKGDITKKDINTVLPFGNTLTVVYLSGTELLEALEASTYCTPAAVGAFPQISGMHIVIDTTKEYDANDETYPGSTYYGPKTINRVTITDINGKEFDKDAVYAVVTHNFAASGGDTYYAFASATEKFDTGLPLDEVLMEYITVALNGVIGEEYAAPKGNITIRDIVIGGLENNVWMTKYGNVITNCTAERFFDEFGFEYGDIVKVTFNGKSLELPVIPTYSYVDSGKPAIVAEAEGYVSLAINMGNFATEYGIADKHVNEDKSWYWTAAEGVAFPIDVKFEMSEKQGYRAEYILRELVRTNERSDYADLSDEQFANFRLIATTGMGKNIFYRTSSPINSKLGRNTYADTALKNAGVTVIMNLCDTAEEAAKYEGFSSTYYSGQKVIYLSLDDDFTADSFKSSLADGLKFFAQNKGVYAVHCTEGKDRAGFVSALLECLMGATADEVVTDYMISYVNYYGVEVGSDKYNAIAEGNIIKSLSAAFETDDIYSADLAECAERYIKSMGLTDDEISALKANLASDASDIPATGDDVPFIAVFALLAAVCAAGYAIKKRI